jgi:hypothetical protein
MATKNLAENTTKTFTFVQSCFENGTKAYHPIAELDWRCEKPRRDLWATDIPQKWFELDLLTQLLHFMMNSIKIYGKRNCERLKLNLMMHDTREYLLNFDR